MQAVTNTTQTAAPKLRISPFAVPPPLKKSLREHEISAHAFVALALAGVPLSASLSKAAGHKYIRREPKPGGGYRYWYNTNTEGALSLDVKAGDALKIAHDGKKGHFKVDAVDGDQITMTHDESGMTVTVSRAGLAKLLHQEHGAALRAKQKHHEAGGAHGAAAAAQDRAALAAYEARRSLILSLRRQPSPPKPAPVFVQPEPELGDDDDISIPYSDDYDVEPEAAPDTKPREPKKPAAGDHQLEGHWEKKLGRPDPGERWDDEEARDWVTQAGNALMWTQIHGESKRDEKGLNNYDADIWSAVVADGDLNEMRYVLRKYWRQLDAESFFKAGLADPLKRMDNIVEPTAHGSMVLLPAKRISDFRAYIDAQKAFKEFGLFFLRQRKTWAIRGQHVMDFPFEAYVKALSEVGVEVEDEAWPPPGFRPPKEGFDRATIDQLTVDDVLNAMKNRQLDDVAVIRRAKGLRGITDGAWVVNSTFSREFNAIVNNREGSLSGIMEYRRDLDHARVTHSLELVEELVERMKQKLPDFAIRVDGLEEARAERESHKAAMEKPIPEVHEKLGRDEHGQTFKLMPHQNEAVRFLQQNDGNGIIGDEMGLGKTLIVLSYAATNPGSKTLVVAPKAVRHQWLDEAARFFPGHFDAQEITTARLNQAKKDIVKHRAAYYASNGLDASAHTEADDVHVIRHALGLDTATLATINYEALGKLRPYLDGFDTLAVDESHRIKNPDAQVTRNIQDLAKDKAHRILMSGTAIKNKKSELFTQTEIVRPGLFPSASDLNTSTIGSAFHKMREVYLGRRKADVMKHLPPKTRAPLRISAPELNGIVEEYIDLAAIRKEERTGRIVWDLPKSPDFQDMSRLKAEIARGKVPHTLDFVKELLRSQDGKVIVFSDSKEAAKEIAKKLGDAAVLHTGDTPDKKRLDIIKQFQDPGSKQRVFVATTASAGVGLNLQVADKVVFNDLPWTPADQEQAEDRAHRATSKNPVNVYAVTAEDNPWDELILETLQRKRVLKEKMLAGKKISEEDRRWAEMKLSPRELLQGLIQKKNGSPTGPEKPAAQSDGEAQPKKTAQVFTGAGRAKIDRDIRSLQDTFIKISGGKTKRAISLAELRAKSGLSRAEQDAAIADAVEHSQIVLLPAREDEVTDADHAAAFIRSGIPRHWLVWHKLVFSPAEQAQVDKNLHALHAAYMELSGGKLEEDVKLDEIAKKAGVSEADARVALKDADDRKVSSVDVPQRRRDFLEFAGDDQKIPDPCGHPAALSGI